MMRVLRPLATLVPSLALATGCAGAGEGSRQSAGSARFPGPPPRVGTDRVARVVDGDTVALRATGDARLIGVDTPEVFGHSDCYGAEASAYTKRLLPRGRRVRYELGHEPRDRYDRALVYLWTGDGRMVNGLLVEGGFATPLAIEPNTDYARRFQAAANRARWARRGLWGACRHR